MVAKDFRRKAWESLKGKWGIMILIFVIYEAIVLAASLISSLIPFGFVVNLLIGGALVIGAAVASLKPIREETPVIEDLFFGFKNCFMQSLLLYVLNSVFIFLWSLLLFVPGIMKSYSYSMSYYILADNPEMDQADARKASIEMMKGNRWRLFCLHISFIGWILLSMLTMGILLFWVMPYMQVAQAAFYEDLKSKNAVVADVETVTEAEPELSYDPEIK